MPVRRTTADAVVWDRIGIGLSGLCAVHCLLTPLVLATLPLWPVVFSAHTWVHLAFGALLIPVTVLAARRARRTVAALLYAGLTVVVLAALLHDVLGAGGGAAATLAGSGLLITGHWRNWHSRSRRASVHTTEPEAISSCSA